MVTSQNAATRIDLQMLSRFNSSIDSGATTNSVGLPSNATRDTLWGNTEVSNGLTDVYPRFLISGLAPSWDHTLTFFASRMGVSDSRQTTYTVTGASSASVDLEAANNTSQTAVMSGVASTPAGTIEVELGPGPLNDSASHFTYLGSLQIDADPGAPAPRQALSMTGNGNGAIVANPALPDYAAGELVELTAQPDPGWVFTGWSGDAAGSSNPVVLMVDESPAVTATFSLANTPPTISPIADQTINENGSTGTLAFTIGDAETLPSLLVVNKYSSNPALVDPSGLDLAGSDANRTITVTPLPDAYGTTTITIAVDDGEFVSETSFLVTVTPVNEAPTA
ncbi:MAG TPA: hypothetical protein VLO11_05340, partial [Luteolibacter sp.]|nr:hypothetical protein [Luteolibacter sp.]